MPTSTLFHPTNQTQHPPLLRMPTVIIRPNTNGSATIIQLNNCNQRSTGYYGRRIQVINGNCASNIKSSRQTRPVIKYNEESLIINKGECPICLDGMDRGDRIARLPCLCIYHKKLLSHLPLNFFYLSCIDAWFSRSNTCPTHPPDD